METKEKRAGQPRTGQSQERRRRPAPAGETGEQRRRPADKASSGKTAAPEKKRPAARPEGKAAPQQRAQERRTERREEANTRRRSAPAEETRQRSARKSAAQTDGRGRPLKPEDGIRYSAPQGTGPRKSAPKMTREEAEALRYRQQSQTPEQPEKKNSLKNLISGIRGGKTEGDAASQAAQRRADRSAREEKKRQRALQHDTPAIIYTQPQVFNRDRLLVQLLSVIAVVAAMVVGMSLFFKVENITVAGEEIYSKKAIVDASGIKNGDGLLTFSKARASAQIRARLHYVDNIRIGIKLPDTVTIYVEELDVTYAIESIQGDLWLINSSGKVVDQIKKSEEGNYTKVNGVLLLDPIPGAQAIAADEIPTETLESGEPVPITVTGAQRLSSVLQILKALEANDIVGEAASVDISDLEDIRMWYGNQYEVLLGNTTRMEYKIACMNDAILELSEFQSGILDVSFITWTDQVGYTPFG